MVNCNLNCVHNLLFVDQLSWQVAHFNTRIRVMHKFRPAGQRWPEPFLLILIQRFLWYLTKSASFFVRFPMNVQQHVSISHLLHANGLFKINKTTSIVLEPKRAFSLYVYYYLFRLHTFFWLVSFPVIGTGVWFSLYLPVHLDGGIQTKRVTWAQTFSVDRHITSRHLFNYSS